LSGRKKADIKRNWVFLPFFIIFLFLQFSLLSPSLTDLYLLPLFYFFFYTPSLVGFGTVIIFALISDSFSPVFFLNTFITTLLFYIFQKQKILPFEKEISQLYILFFLFILLFILSKIFILWALWDKAVSLWILTKPFSYTMLLIALSFVFERLRLKYIKE
jgi:hypothetical protein